VTVGKDDPSLKSDQTALPGCGAIGAIFAILAFMGWASGGWEEGYQRERTLRQQTYERWRDRPTKSNPDEVDWRTQQQWDREESYNPR
jgi:hypothetical protein